MAADPESSAFLYKVIGAVSVATVGLTRLLIGNTLKRIDKAETDLKDHKKVVYSKFEKQDDLLAKAVDKLATTHTLNRVCLSNHAAIEKQIDSLIKLSDEQHGHTRDLLASVVEELKGIKGRLDK